MKKYLSKVNGIIHVGGHYAEEADLYNRYNLNVLWVEASKESYDILVEKIQKYPKQKAINQLVTDKDGIEYDFHISNNSGLSSSILDLNLHRKFWPEIDYINSVKIKSKTLPTIILESKIDIEQYNALSLDTQGSELSILESFKEFLHNMYFIKVEAANFEAYKNCCTDSSITNFLTNNNFYLDYYTIFANRGDLKYFDLYFLNNALYTK